MTPVFAPSTSARLHAGEESIVITGAGGWLGRALAEMLAVALGADATRRLLLCGSSSRLLQLQNGTILPIYTLEEGLAHLGNDCPAFICHFAFLTKDRVSQMSDQEYISRNRELAAKVLDAANRRNVRGILLSSSGAVYDYLNSGERDGAANLYGMLKAEDEVHFARLCEMHGIPLVMPRIFNVSGPFINKFDAYALSSIIVDVLKGGPVQLHATRPVYRSYVHVGDILELCVSSLLNAAGHGASGVLMFDTRGDELLEVGDLAERIGSVLGRGDVGIMRPPFESEVADYYVGEPQALAELLQRHRYQLTNLDRQILDTAEYIRQMLKAA